MPRTSAVTSDTDSIMRSMKERRRRRSEKESGDSEEVLTPGAGACAFVAPQLYGHGDAADRILIIPNRQF